MATWTKFNSFPEALAEKAHNLGADTLKMALTNTAPSASADALLADITEISAGNGYTAGGETAAITSSAQTAGVYKLVLGTVTFTAAGGAIGPFRWIVLYNSTATNDELIAYLDYGAAYSIPDTETFSIPTNANGVLTLG